MTPFEDFFDGNIFVINLARRPDRLEHFKFEMNKCGITCWQRFDAVDAGPRDGNRGCTASHRAIMDMVVRRGLKRAFVFEDDATLRHQFITCFNQEIAPVLNEMPAEFDQLYVGGHYAEMPRGWHSKHLILMGAMKTTSSYGVTLKSARELRDLIPEDTCDSIDNLYAGYNATKRCFISEPRFFVQYGNFSDLQQREMDNSGCMEDTSHVSQLGNIGRKGAKPVQPPPPPPPPAPEPAPAPVKESPLAGGLWPKPVISWSGRAARRKHLPT